MHDDEINRLIKAGLLIQTAISVTNGELDEEFEIARAQERTKVRKWCKEQSIIPTTLIAKWDLNPERFYLVFDGDAPNDHNPNEFMVIEYPVEKIANHLTFISSRDKDPWHNKYKSKSCGVAYRWSHNLGVTPPLLTEFKGQIHIVGGMHRFHLARYYETMEMPFLVRMPDIIKIETLLNK